ARGRRRGGAGEPDEREAAARGAGRGPEVRAPRRGAELRGLEGRVADGRGGRQREAALGGGADRWDVRGAGGEEGLHAAPAGGARPPEGAREERRRLQRAAGRQGRDRERAVPDRGAARVG